MGKGRERERDRLTVSHVLLHLLSWDLLPSDGRDEEITRRSCLRLLSLALLGGRGLGGLGVVSMTNQCLALSCGRGRGRGWSTGWRRWCHLLDTNANTCTVPTIYIIHVHVHVDYMCMHVHAHIPFPMTYHLLCLIGCRCFRLVLLQLHLYLLHLPSIIKTIILLLL